MLEAEFEQRLRTAKLEAMAELAAGAGHEINNPLAVISGRAQLLLRDETDPERRRELAVMHAQARRVHEMIADMMLFARPPKPVLEQCDLSLLLADLVGELQARAADRQVYLTLLPAEGAHSAKVDRTQLAVAIRALCDNALEASLPGGKIELTVRPAAEGIEIRVRDDGPGIAPDVQQHLFEPFFSGRQSGRGIGMGLAKCWRIVTGHAGRIDFETEPGVGTTFRILLPPA